MSASEPILRHAARVLVVDSRGRVLLQQYKVPGGTEVFWATPGGGLDPGETHEAAARRELREELGVTCEALGPCIWIREHVFPWDGRIYRQRERIFLWRVEPFELPPITAPIDVAITAHRWWTLEELREARETMFAPRRFSVFLEALLRDGPPAEPVDVGV